MRSFFARPNLRLKFTCRPEDHGVIAEPTPSKGHMPDWFKKLPAIDPEVASRTDTGLTVKRCMPFLDAMTTGWIIPLAATVRMEVSDNGARVECSWDFDRTMVSNHGPHQVKGHPMSHLPPCKFHNYWTVTTPPGWSCLFINPLNRPNKIFEIVSGIVDTDTYRSEIHFPFFAVAEDGVHTIEKGTPIAQVIPFKRDATALETFVGPADKDAAEDRERIMRLTKASTGWYRENARAKR